ncbi:MAG: hypothetical protein QW156_04435 [Candidatus Aenigmatarchaeota archaeon]
MDEEKTITLPREFKARFSIRVRSKRAENSKEPVWIELSNRSDDFSEIASQINAIIKQWEVSLPTLEFEAEKIEKQEEFIYSCENCGYEIPYEPDMPMEVNLFCPTCKKWTKWKKMPKR